MVTVYFLVRLKREKLKKITYISESFANFKFVTRSMIWILNIHFLPLLSLGNFKGSSVTHCLWSSLRSALEMPPCYENLSGQMFYFQQNRVQNFKVSFTAWLTVQFCSYCSPRDSLGLTMNRLIWNWHFSSYDLKVKWSKWKLWWRQL